MLDLLAIAERIRCVVAGNQADVDLLASAERLRVDPQSLARSIRVEHPRPSLAVLTAIVRDYGIDPSWLVHGDYDLAAHALALEKGATITPDDVVRLVDSPRHVKVDDGPEHRAQGQLSP